MTALNKQALRLTAEKAKDNFMPNFMVPTRDVLALLDELEAAEKRNAELEGIVFSVKLPVAPLQHETLKLCLETSDGYGMQKGAEYMRDEIIKVLHAAGIGVKGE